MNFQTYPTYPMAYPQPMYANNQMKSPTISYGMNWVNGIEGAKAVQLPINTTAPFFDSEQNTVYIKTSDNIGMSTIKIFDLVERVEKKNESKNDIDLSQYVTKQELEDIINKLKVGRNNESVSANESTTNRNKSKQN